MIYNERIEGLEDVSNVRSLPVWDDAANQSLEDCARAYVDVNCAHCRIDGGYCDLQSSLRLGFETSFTDSNIQSQKNSIISKVSSDFQPVLTMSWIDTTILHEEGVNLILQYLNTLQ